MKTRVRHLYRKKILLASLIVLLFFSVYSTLFSGQFILKEAEAQTTPVIFVDPKTTFKNTGESFTINIKVDMGTTPLYAFEFYLYYNRTVLTLTWLEEGPFFDSYNANNFFVAAPGVGYILVGNTFTVIVPGPTGTGTLASLTFSVAAVGTSLLDLITDYPSGLFELGPAPTYPLLPIEHVVQDGYFNYSPGDLIWSVATNPSAGYDVASSVAVDSTGVYVVGYDNATGNLRWRMEKRSLTTGGVIWSKSYNPSTGVDRASDVAVDSTGVYVVGIDSTPGNWQWRMEKRSLTTGGVIWSKSYNPSTRADAASGVAVDGTGVYIVGYDSVPSSTNTQWRMQKRNMTTGGVIWSKSVNPSTRIDAACDVAVDSTGVYVVGYDNATGNLRWRMEKRSLTTGSLIWSNSSNPSTRADAAWGVAVDGTGVYIVGYDSKPSSTNTQWRMEKRSLTTGWVIWSKVSNPSTGADEAYGVAVDATGVYIVGYDSKPGLGNTRWRIEKRHP